MTQTEAGGLSLPDDTRLALSPEGQRLNNILSRQGRSMTWLADQLGITRNYLWRQTLQEGNTYYRRPTPRLWRRIEDILAVPGEILRQQ